MRHSLPLTPQFYVTAPQACPYIEGHRERKLFTALQGSGAGALNDKLSCCIFFFIKTMFHASIFIHLIF